MKMQVLKDAFGNHLCVSKFGTIATFDPEQWKALTLQVATELLDVNEDAHFVDMRGQIEQTVVNLQKELYGTGE